MLCTSNSSEQITFSLPPNYKILASVLELFSSYYSKRVHLLLIYFGFKLLFSGVIHNLFLDCQTTI